MLPNRARRFARRAETRINTHDARSCQHSRVVKLVLDVDLEVVSLVESRGVNGKPSLSIYRFKTYRVASYYRSWESAVRKDSIS